MWIYEQKGWPKFTWDKAGLAQKLAEVRYQQGRLLGRMEGLGFKLRKEASLDNLTMDVVKSSAIEGEKLDEQEVRSSIGRRLGLDFAGMVEASRHVEGVVELMLDATQRYSEPLTDERLFNWHAALFPTGRSGMYKITVGGWRTDENGRMQVVSGPVGREKVHYEAPVAKQLDTEMRSFLEWFEGDSNTDQVVKAGLAHFWFVTVHPFDDGNGRTARAIADLALARADCTADRFYSMSSQIEKERKEYYLQLERQQTSSLDVTGWLEWFQGCLGRAIQAAEENVSVVLEKSEFWERVNRQPVNDRQKKVLNRMLDNFKDHMSTSKYAKMAKCSNDTALRDIQELLKRGILLQNPGGGRSTSYRLAVATNNMQQS